MLENSNQQDRQRHNGWGFAARCGCFLMATSGLMPRACLRLLEPATPDADLVSVWPAAATAAAACALVTTPIAAGGVTRMPWSAAVFLLLLGLLLETVAGRACS